jgi:NADH-quinone oxidoreductase subunit C
VTDTPATPDASAEVAPVVPADVPTLPVVDVRSGLFGGSGSGDTSGFGGLVRTIAFPAPTPRPFGGWYDEVADELDLALQDDGLSLDDAVAAVVVANGEITFHVHAEHLLAFVTRLRDEPALRFEMCLGVSGVHYPGMAGAELHAVWHFQSVTFNRRIRVEVACSEEHPHVPSIVSVYPADDWHEREAFDMFGIVFDGHPGLTRILMPDDWVGFPQRKDYPLGGIPVEYKGASIPPPDTRRSYT